jgi:hypothetical protein
MLTYNGANATQVVVTPGLPMGVVTDTPGGQATDLYPGALAPISYPIRAVQSGTYMITSQIAYAEDGTWRELRLEAPFTAEGETSPPLTPDDVSAGAIGSGMPPGEAPLGEVPPAEAPPFKPLPGEIVSLPQGPGEISNMTPNEALDSTMGSGPSGMPSGMPEMSGGIDPSQKGPAGQ